MPISYTKRGWTNNSPPAINAANLGAMDDGIKQACDGVDALSVAPPAHANSHQHGGTDEVGTATPAANAIPKADGSGKLDSWVSDATTTVKGKVQLATAAELETGTDASKVLTPAVVRPATIKRTKMPDGATAVYSQDAWATTDWWSAYSGTASVGITPGSIRFTATGTSIPGLTRSITGIGGKTLVFRYKTNFANASARLRVTYGGGTITLADLPQTNSLQVAFFILPAYFLIESLWPIITDATVGDWYEIDWIWIGNYSYLTGTLSEEAARIADQLGDTAGVGVAASGTISLGAGGNYVAGETITIGGFVYTFRALVSELTAPGDVLIGAALRNSHENLSRAISRVLPSLYDASSGGTDPRYYTPAAYIHPLVSALMPGAIVNLTAILPGDFGNKIALSTSAPTKCIFSASTLTGGYSATAKKLATLAAPIIAGNGTRPAAALIELTDTTKIGYEHAVDVASGDTVTLPSSGTWLWFVYGYGATISSAKKGSSAGGTVLTVAGANATVWYRRYA